MKGILQRHRSIHVGEASHSVHTSTSGAGVGSITSASTDICSVKMFDEMPVASIFCTDWAPAMEDSLGACKVLVPGLPKKRIGVREGASAIKVGSSSAAATSLK